MAIICSICGIIDFKEPQINDRETLQKMCSTMTHRGPDQSGIYLTYHVALGHNRLAIIDIKNGLQPMTRRYRNRSYTIVYNGELYNTPELSVEIEKNGIRLETTCDTEVVLYSYILWGEKCVEKLNGIFAFAVHDESENRVFLARDRFGVKPLFYAKVGSALVFASEIKALLEHPKIKPSIDRIGLWQLLFLSPMKLSGSGVFRDIYEIPPAHYAFYDVDGLKLCEYWALQAKEFIGCAEDAALETKNILTDAIRKQLVSDVPLCTFLSGGLDSSIISAVAAEHYKQSNQILSTYSFEYPDNKINFKQSLFQPQADDEYAKFLADYLGTDHTVLNAETSKLVELLFAATSARDLPGMADIDSSLLYYCSEVKKKHTVALSGECADEIFGGYPWFYRKEMLEKDFYPWIHNPFSRISLFRSDVILPKDGYDYLSSAYQADIANFPKLDNDSESMLNSRKATFLSTKYFMTSLLERKDRMSMASGVEVRVPFSDHRVLEYVYNVPWEIKFAENTEKALLREAMKEYLPDKILNRKKSPYPKTHDPQYEQLVLKILKERLSNKSSQLHNILDKSTLEDKIGSSNDTWFGQLMSRPQLFSWIVQLDYWLEKYNIEIEL